MARYEATLPSGTVVEMVHWDLGWANEQANSRMSQVRLETSLLTRCLAQVVDPGIYAGKMRDGRLDWRDVTTTDRSVALVAARVATHGPKLSLDLKCPDKFCRGWLHPIGASAVLGGSRAVLDLDDLLATRVFEMPRETREKLAAGDNRFSTTYDGHRIEFRILTGRDAEQVEEYVRQGRDQAVTRSLAARILRFDDLTERSDIEERLRGEGAGIVQILSDMNAADGGIDDEIELECEKCSRVVDGNVPFSSQTFLMPVKEVARKRMTVRRGG